MCFRCFSQCQSGNRRGIRQNLPLLQYEETISAFPHAARDDNDGHCAERVGAKCTGATVERPRQKGRPSPALDEPVATLDKEKTGRSVYIYCLFYKYPWTGAVSCPMLGPGKRNSLGIPESVPTRNDGSRMLRETGQGNPKGECLSLALNV